MKRINYLTRPGSSHDGRLIAYLSEMAVVMAGESDGAETWLDYSLKAMTTFYPHWGGYEGGWAEGTGYGLPYNEFYIPAFEALRMTADFDLWRRPFFNKVRYGTDGCSDDGELVGHGFQEHKPERLQPGRKAEDRCLFIVRFYLFQGDFAHNITARKR